VRFTAGHGDEEKVLQHMQELVQEIHLWQEGVSHPSLFTLSLTDSALARFLPVMSAWNSACGSRGKGGSQRWWITGTLIRLVLCCRGVFKDREWNRSIWNYFVHFIQISFIVCLFFISKDSRQLDFCLNKLVQILP